MKHKLTLGAATYDDSILMGGIDYAIDINGGDVLTVGVAACGTMRFTVVSPCPFAVGDEIVWSRMQIEEENYTEIGRFTVTAVTRQRGTYTVEAADGMAKFDVPIDAWLNGLTYPTTHNALLRGLCTHVGVTLSSTSTLTNGDRAVPSSPAWEGATGRDILGFLAEASGCFARMLPDGSLYVGWYRQTDVALTRANYSRPFVADYTVSAVDRVQVRSSRNDIGVVVGTGENAYIIENNPLFFAESDADLRPYAERLLAKLSALTYTPCEVPMYNDRGLRPGDIFTIDGVQSVVMALRCTETGSVITSTGSETRPTQSTAANRDVLMLVGKTNELIRTVDETTIRLSNAEGQVTTLTATVNGFEGRIENAEAEVLSLTARADTFDVSLSNANKDIATLSAKADSITLSVNQNSLAITQLGVDVAGRVTFDDLAGNGNPGTIINGGIIKTGTITAITLEGCRFTSNNSRDGYSSMTLDGAMLMFSGTYGDIGGMYANSFNELRLYGYPLVLGANTLIEYNNSTHWLIHAGNINNYIGNVYAVFG